MVLYYRYWNVVCYQLGGLVRENMQKSSKQARFTIQPHIVIKSLTGDIQLDLFGIVYHTPGHWVCRSMMADFLNPNNGLNNEVYYYDDLTGSAEVDKLIDDMMTDTSASGLIYLKRTTLRYDDIKSGTFVRVFNEEGKAFIQGSVEYSMGSHDIIKIDAAIIPNESTNQFKKHCNVVTAASAIGSLFVSPRLLTSVIPQPKQQTQSQEGKRKKHQMAHNSDSEAESYDIDLQRVLAKSGRRLNLYISLFVYK